MKNKRKKILVGAAVLLLLAAVSYLAGGFILGSAIKAGIKTALPGITGTDVEVDSVFLSPLSGHISVKGFKIYNPPEFSESHAMKADRIEVMVSPLSLFREEIHVKKILIDKLEVHYERKLTRSNLGTIEKHAKQAVSGEKEADSGAKTTEPEKEKSRRQLVIDRLDIKNTRLMASTDLIAVKTGASVALPDIQILDIGKEKEPMKPAEAFTVIFSALYEMVLQAVKDGGNIIKDIFR